MFLKGSSPPFFTRALFNQDIDIATGQILFEMNNTFYGSIHYIALLQYNEKTKASILSGTFVPKLRC